MGDHLNGRERNTVTPTDIGQPPPAPYPRADGAESNDVQARAAEAAGQAQQTAQQAAGQAQVKLREQLNQRSSQVAGQINEQASDLRSVSQALREQGKDGPAKAADRLAEYAERVGGYLRDKDSDALLADAEDFGRRRPWAVVAGGMALGLAASRVLKASSSQRYQTRTAGAQPAPATASAGSETSVPFPPTPAAGVPPLV
jgi:ElaB/YqjD/DUF883 family membrane-anchored ribosome-binding protein